MFFKVVVFMKKSMKNNLFLNKTSCAEPATPVPHLALRVENKAF